MNNQKITSSKRWIAVLSLVVGLAFGVSASVGINGLSYELNDKNLTASITGYYNKLPENVVVPDSILIGNHYYKVTTIENNAFSNCTWMQSISIPPTVTRIGTSVHYSTSESGEQLWHGNAGKTLPFYNCTNLKSVIFKDGPNTLSISNDWSSYEDYYSKGAFYYCPVEYVYVGRDISANEWYNYNTVKVAPFYKNASLKTVIIGQNVTSLPRYMFDQCNNLSDVISYADNPPSLHTTPFPTSRYSIINLYILPSSFDLYNSAEIWSSFDNKIGMIKKDNLLFIPQTSSTVAVTKLPESNPTSLTIPSIVNDGDKNWTVRSVLENAFKECPDLTLVEFANTITEIGANAFSGNTKLSSIVFDGQQVIKEAAFANCPSITSLDFPSTLKSIEKNAFINNTGVTAVSFGNNLNDIGVSAFKGCVALTAVKLPDLVTTIGDSCFEDCIKLTYATLGNSLEFLGNNSFKNCKALTEITMPNTTTSIGHGAFENCSNLSLVTLNNGLLTMGTNTFKGCKSLLAMTIPGSVTDIGRGSFDGCSMISSVNFQAGQNPITIANFPDSPIKTLRIGRNMTYACSGVSSPFKDKKTLTRVLFSGNYVTTLYDYLLDGCSAITQITLPSNLETINTYVFRGCTGLTNMSIPGTVTSIGNNSFEGCSGLKDLVFEDGSADITLGSESGLFSGSPLESLFVGRNIKHSAEKPEQSPFYGQELLTNLRISNTGYVTTLCDYFVDKATTLKTVVIPEGVTKIRQYSFANCNSLVSITFPESLDQIGQYGFADCKSLVNVTLPNNLASIGQYGFTGCTSMERITLSGKLHAMNTGLLYGCTNLKSLSIPASVTSVADRAIGLCPNITSLIFEDASSVITVGIADDNLGMCAETGLETLYIGRNINYTATADAGYSPFYNLKKLKDVTFNMNGTITNLGDYYLAGCSAVESLTLPQSITSIGSYGFYDDSSLAAVNFPTKVEILKNNLFANCLKLEEFTIYPAVTSIEDNVFINCASLAKVTFQDNTGLLTIGRRKVNNNYASIFADSPITSLYLGRWLVYDVTQESTSPFYSQRSLTDLKFGSTVGDIGKYLFEKCSALKVANIPGVESIGEKAFYYCTSLNDLKLNNGTKSLGEQSFANCSGLKNIELPPSVISLSDGCFMNCTNIVSVNLGTSLEIIGPRAFTNCTSLRELTIPETVYGLGVESFQNCTAIPFVNIPKGISSVGARSFQGCTGVQWITLSNRVTSLGAQSFDGCSNIRYIKSYNEVPPVGMPSFAQDVIDYATVFVPEGFVPDYQESDTWWEFFSIREMTNAEFITTLTLDKKEASIKVSESIQLNAVAGPSTATDTSVGYTTDNADVATVDQNGLVTAHNLGEAKIKVFAKDGSGLYEICHITVIPTMVESISINAANTSLKKDRTLDLTASVLPATATNSNVVWSSSDSNLAAVDEHGVVTAIKPGEVQITATAADGSGIYALFTLTVIPPMAGDSNDNDAVTITDAVNTANYAVGNEVADFCFEAADVDGNGRVTLSDASATVRLVLEQPAMTAPARIRAMATTELLPDCLVIDDYSAGEECTIGVRLENKVDYVAMQADILVPDGMEIVNVGAGARAEVFHSVATNQICDNVVRVALFDFDNNTFADNTENLLELTVRSKRDTTGSIVMTNALGSDGRANEYVLTSTGGNNAVLSGIDAVLTAGNITVKGEGDAVVVYNAEHYDIAVYTADGMLVKHVNAVSNIEKIALAPGIYVVAVENVVEKLFIK